MVGILTEEVGHDDRYRAGFAHCTRLYVSGRHTMNKKVDAIETQLIQIKSRNSTRKSRNSLSVRARRLRKGEKAQGTAKSNTTHLKNFPRLTLKALKTYPDSL